MSLFFHANWTENWGLATTGPAFSCLSSLGGGIGLAQVVLKTRPKIKPEIELEMQASVETAGFPDTLWSAIDRAKGQDSAEAAAALERLCQRYRPALRSVLIRWGQSESDADDLLHDFLTTKFLRQSFFANVRRGEGQFRTFLKTCLENFLRSRHRKGRNQGALVSVDASGELRAEEFYSRELPPDQWMDLAWARQVVFNAKLLLREEARAAGKEGLWEALSLILDDDMEAPSLKEVAERLGMTETNVGVAFHRFRERLRWLIREEIRQTVANPSQWKQELDHLVAILRI